MKVGDIYKRNNNYDGEFYGNYIIIIINVTTSKGIAFRKEDKQIHSIGSFSIDEFNERFNKVAYV
jgi:hypothetical protein